jgi:hypothetical protein
MTARKLSAEFSREEKEAIELFLISCTVPLIYQDEKQTVVLGTGTFFEFDEHYFLVTAGHLFNGIDPSNLHVPACSGSDVHTVPIDEFTIHSPKDTDEYDVAVIELLDAEFLRVVKSGWRFLTMANVGVSAPSATQYIVAGYPNETVSYNSGVLRPTEFLQLYTGPYEGAIVGDRGEFDLFLRYGRQALNTHGRNRDTPDLRGVSGASVFLVTPPQSTIWIPEEIIRIVGIQIAFVHSKYIRAKRWSLIEYVLKLVKDFNPE